MSYTWVNTYSAYLVIIYKSKQKQNSVKYISNE